MTEPNDKAKPETDFKLLLENVVKAFGRRRICADVSLDLKAGDRLAVVGPNGSGKTTFLMMLCGLSRPDRGTISYSVGGSSVERERWHEFVGLVAPDLALYDELTALENLRFINKIGGCGKNEDDLHTILAELGLGGREYDLLGTFSSGMKQRLKYAGALVKSPPLLLLDEPTANLDETGIQLFHEVIKTQRSRGICVLATNDRQEANLADRQIVMGR